MERKLGEIFIYKGKTYKVIKPTYGCRGCAFYSKSCFNINNKEECIADIFIETVNACRKQNIDSLKAVVSSIAKRKSIDLFRKLSGKNRYSSYMEEITDEPADYDTPETFSAGRTEKENLWNEVKKLGEPDSDILILQFFYDKTAKEIGNILKMTAEAVTKRSQRARQKLRKILTESEVI